MVGNLKKITVFFKFPTVFLRKKKEKVRVGEGKFLTFVFFLVLIYISTLEILPSSEGFLFNYTYL